MSIEAMSSCWGEAFPTKAEGLESSSVRLVAIAIADVVNDLNRNEFYGSLGNLAAKVGVHRNTVQRVVGYLVTAGVMEIVREQIGRPTVYRWVWFPARTSRSDREVSDSDLAGEPRPPRGSDREPPRGSDRDEPNGSTQGKPKTPLTPRKRGEPCSGEDVDQFESFWRSWLDICNARGVPCGSKQNAAIRWGAAPTASGRRSKSRLTRDDRTAVMASFEEWKIYYSDPRSQTPPHAVTWLNQRRWETPPPKVNGYTVNGTAVADRALISELGSMVRKFTPVKGYAMFVERHGPLTDAQWVLYDATYPNPIYRVARDVTVSS